MKENKMEILAPAGSLQALYAAVAAGADAIYLGGKQFNARAFATNFSEKEIESGIRFSHRHGVRVYMTMNTLVREEEMEEALRYARLLFEQGVDALILQDIGLLRGIRRELPDLEVHASTQMTLHNQEGVQWAAEQGFGRVVLARELSISEIRLIQETSPIGIEVFAHGALCFAYSGQCYMSSFLGGRSGNRGRCAQPCRLAYTIDDKDSFPLSTKDLCLLEEVRSLKMAGIQAIKIEGRMKKPSYVYQVVRRYREAVDSLMDENPKSVSETTDEALRLAFNRDFSKGFAFESKSPELLSSDFPGNRGLELARWNPEEFSLVKKPRYSVRQPLYETDRMLLRQGGRELVFELTESYLPGQPMMLPEFPIQPGVEPVVLSLLDSKPFQQETENQISLIPTKLKTRPVLLDLVLTLKENQPVQLHIQNGSEIHHFQYPQSLPQKAKGQGLTELKIRQSFEKLHDTPFEIRSLRLDTEEPLHLTASSLNAVRREWTDILWFGHSRQQVHLDSAEMKPRIRKELQKKKPSLQFSVSTREQAITLMQIQAKSISLGGDSFFGRLTREQLVEVLTEAKSRDVEMEFSLPTLIHDSEWACWNSLLEVVVASDCPVKIAQPAHLLVMKKRYPSARLRGDWSLQLMNLEAIRLLQESAVFERLTVYPELSLQQANEFPLYFPETEWQYGVGGRQNLMISNHCLTWNRNGSCLQCYMNGRNHPPEPWQMTDRIGKKILIAQNQFCRTHLLNSDELCLVEHYYQLQRSGFNLWNVDLRHLSIEKMVFVAQVWLDSIVQFQENSDEWLQQGKVYRQQLEQLLESETTKGHTFRGVE